MGDKSRKGKAKGKAKEADGDDDSNGGVSMVVVMTGNSSLEVEDAIFEAIKQSTASFTFKPNQGLYVWEVRNFITLKNLLQKGNITGLAIKSGLFEIEDHKFRLVVYPRGNSQPPIHLAVFLEKENKEDSSTEDSCFSSFHFSVVKRGVSYSGRKGSGRKGSKSKGSANTRSPQSRYVTKGLHGRISNADKALGWANFIDLQTLFDPTCGFLLDSTITFNAEVVILEEQFLRGNDEITNAGFTLGGLGDGEFFLWSIENFSCSPFLEILKADEIVSPWFRCGALKIRMVIFIQDGIVGAKLRRDLSTTMDDSIEHIGQLPKLGVVNQQNYNEVVGADYCFSTDLSSEDSLDNAVWLLKLSKMLDEGYIVDGAALFMCRIQPRNPRYKVSTEAAESSEVTSSENEDDIFGSILKRADSSVSQPKVLDEGYIVDGSAVFMCHIQPRDPHYKGVVEAVRVSLADFPTRKTYHDFVDRFGVIALDIKDGSYTKKTTTEMILKKLKLDNYQLGKTKVFLTAGQIGVFDSQRAEVLVRLDTARECIRGPLRAYVARRDFLSTRVAAVSLQACCRGYLARKRYSEKREASSAISIQKYVRRWLLVGAYTKLRFSTLLIQSSIRGFLARQSFTQRNEHKAAMLIQSHWRMCKVRSAFRRRQVNIIAIQRLWRQKLAKRELRRLKKEANETGALRLAKTKLEKQLELPINSMGRSAGFNLGGTYSLHRPQQQQQQQQHAPSVSSSGVPFSSVTNHDLLHLHGSDMFQSSHSSYHSQTSGPPGIGLRPLNSPNTVSGMGSYDQLIQQYQQHQNQSQFQLQQMPGLNQSHRDQGVKSMQSAQAAPDSFGLLGLFRMSDPDLTSLALGIDLTTLGMNLNSTENLHKTFGSPWSDDPAKGDPEFVVPQCYYAKQPPALSQSHFLKFPMDTLFYIFYSMPKDEAQLYAANELYNRGWFYHRELRQWLTRVPNMEPLVKTNTYERGSYICFDPNTWEKIRKDNFVVHYEMLEKRPNLPQH